MSNEITIAGMPALSPEDVQAQVNLVQKVMAQVMQQDTHYGTVPGCGDRKVLLKAGAEKLCFTFRLQPTYEVTVTAMESGHREVQVVCTLKSGDTVVAQGLGCCSTMESKYRYRRSKSACPSCGNEETLNKSKRKPEFYCWKKIGGCGATFPLDDPSIEPPGKIENPDLADCYNTVLKMAKKRAHVDAAITATAASDIFTQDIEENEEGEAPVPEPPQHSPESQTSNIRTDPPPRPDMNARAREQAARREAAKQDREPTSTVETADELEISMWRERLISAPTPEDYARAKREMASNTNRFSEMQRESLREVCADVEAELQKIAVQ